MMPKAKTDDLLTSRVGDELVVYDRRDDRAHRLNRLAAEVWEHCDGRRDLSSLVGTVDDRLPGGVNEANVALALQELEQAGLVESSGADGAAASSLMDRRTALKRAAQVGSAALLVPLVASMAAPTPAMASSSSSSSSSTSSTSSTQDEQEECEQQEWETDDSSEDEDPWEKYDGDRCRNGR